MNPNSNKLNKSVIKPKQNNLLNFLINKPKAHYSNNLITKSMKNFENNYFNKTKSKSMEKISNNSNTNSKIDDEVLKRESSSVQKRLNIRRVKTYANDKFNSDHTSSSPKSKSNKLRIPKRDELAIRKSTNLQKRKIRLSKNSNFIMNCSSPNVKKLALNISSVFVAKKKRNIESDKKIEVDGQNVVNLKLIGNELLLKIKDMQGSIIESPRKMRSFIASKININKKFQDEIGTPNSRNFCKTPKNAAFNKFNMSISKFNNQTNNTEYDKFRFLEIKKQIYDSFGDNESEEDSDIEGTVIYPESYFIFILDALLLIFTMFYSIYVPFIIANMECFCNSNNLLREIIFCFIDILFVIDLCVSFFRAFYNFELKLVKSNSKIIIHYLKGDFFSDLITAIPIYSIYCSICNHNKETKICYQFYIPDYLFYIELFMNLKIIKMLKINSKNKNVALHYMLELSSENYSFEKTTTFINNTIFCFLFLHFFVCFNIFIGKQKNPSWLIILKSNDNSFTYNYIASLYSLLQALTTVGYGDSLGYSLAERIFQILVIAIGDVVYSYLISYVGNTIKNDSHAKIKFNNDLDILRGIRSNYPQIPAKLFNKIYHHLESRTKAEKSFDANLLINSLPFNYKNKIIYVMYENVINNFAFFKKCENSDFIVKVLQSFRPTTAKKYEFLIYEGEMIDDIVLVKDGRLSLQAAIDVENPEKSIRNYLKKNFEGINKKEERRRFSVVNNQFLLQKIANNQITKKRKNYKLFKEELSKAIHIGTNVLADNENDEDSEDNSSDNGNLKLPNKKKYTDINKILGNAPIKNDEGNYKYLKIIDIRKNENFGGLYMFLRRPAPLSLQVRTKMAEIYLLPKKDVFSISKSYPNIWKKIQQKDFHNMISIKNMTICTLRKYIKINGLVVDGISNFADISHFLEKSKFIFQRNSKNSCSDVTSVGIDKKKFLLSRDSKFSEISNNLIKKNSNNNSNRNIENTISEIILPENELNKIKLDFKNSSSKRSSALSPTNKKKSLIDFYESSQPTPKKSVSGNSTKREQFATVIINTNNNNNQQPKTLLNIMSEKSAQQMIKKMQRNKKFEKIIQCINFQEKMPQFLQLLENKENPNKNVSTSQNLSNFNNFCSRIYQNNILLQIKAIIDDEDNNSPTNKNFNVEDFKQTSTNFSINSSYENINLITKGKYLEDEEFRKETKKFLIDSLDIENTSYNTSNYNENFSSISFNSSNNYFKKDSQKNRSNSEKSKKSKHIKNYFNDNSSTFSEMLKLKQQKNDKKNNMSNKKLLKTKMTQTNQPKKENCEFTFKHHSQKFNTQEKKNLILKNNEKKMDKKSPIKNKKKVESRRSKKNCESARKISHKDNIKISDKEIPLTKSPKRLSKRKSIQDCSKTPNFSNFTMKNLKIMNVKNQDILFGKKNYKRVNTGNRELFSNVGTNYFGTKKDKDKDCLIY